METIVNREKDERKSLYEFFSKIFIVAILCIQHLLF